MFYSLNSIFSVNSVPLCKISVCVFLLLLSFIRAFYSPSAPFVRRVALCLLASITLVTLNFSSLIFTPCLGTLLPATLLCIGALFIQKISLTSSTNAAKTIFLKSHKLVSINVFKISKQLPAKSISIHTPVWHKTCD